MAQDRNPGPNHTIVPERTYVRQKGLKQHLKAYLKNNHMTTKTAIMAKPKQKNPKFRVHPGLSIRSTELRSRIKNRSIQLDDEGQYTLDQTMHEAMSMSKPERVNMAIRNSERINELQMELQYAEKTRNKADQERINKDLKELEELRNKEKNQPKP